MIGVVTVKLLRNPKHNPRNKKTGTCPISGKAGKLIWCTDTTGSHHSYIETGLTEGEIERKVKRKGFTHITRIEFFDEKVICWIEFLEILKKRKPNMTEQELNSIANVYQDLTECGLQIVKEV